MNILASNDDGILCDGITCLIKALKKRGHRVLAIVPDRNRSGASHSITFDLSMRLKKAEDGIWVYGGTPVDCVLSGLVRGGFEFAPDLVVSGINAGANLGTDIIYSGTAAAARQGSLFGLPAIAFSVDGSAPYQFEYAAEWSAANLEMLTKLCLQGTFVNVNYPNNGTFKDFALTYPSLRIYDDMVVKEETEEGEAFSMPGAGVKVRQGVQGGVLTPAPGALSDWDAVMQGKVSVSVLYNHPVAVADALVKTKL